MSDEPKPPLHVTVAWSAATRSYEAITHIDVPSGGEGPHTVTTWGGTRAEALRAMAVTLDMLSNRVVAEEGGGDQGGGQDPGDSPCDSADDLT